MEKCLLQFTKTDYCSKVISIGGNCFWKQKKLGTCKKFFLRKSNNYIWKLSLRKYFKGNHISRGIVERKKSIKEFKDDPNIQNTKNKQYAKKNFNAECQAYQRKLLTKISISKLEFKQMILGKKSSNIEYEIFRQIKTITKWALFKGKIINYLTNESNRNIFEAPGPSLLKTYFSNTFQGLSTNKHFSPPKISIFQVKYAFLPVIDKSLMSG